jgi:GT2 family glycosyltransferase
MSAPAVPGASVVVVSYNSADDLPGFVESLRGEPDLHEIVVVDNASVDGSAALVRERYPEVRLVEPGANLGFGGGANAGVAVSSGDVVVIANPDVRFRPGALAWLVEEARRSGGIVGPMLDTLGYEQPWFGKHLDWLGMPRALYEPGPFFYVQGCAMAMLRTTFEALGGFDERYFLFVEDVELCWRAHLVGLPVVIDERAVVGHAGGATVGGGYVRSGARTTSDLRFRLRERNTLTAFLACAPAAYLLLFVPLHVGKLVATAVVVTVAGRRRLGRDLLTDLASNLRQLEATWRRRRSLHGAHRWAALRRLDRRVAAYDLLKRDGLPRFTGAA